ncbi:MAG: ABC transporter ATP-binding protein [bacterium]
MSKPIIEIESISKLYRLGIIGATTLRDSLERRWNRLLGRARLKTKLGASGLLIEKDHPQAGTEPNTFWALKEVSFSVKKGEVVGIIGKNGAGKSTLLKILSRITEPTSGQAVLRGRTASLLEVGTGFHGELSGRENIYLNGAMLGMRKLEVARKFDEIVDFSGVEEFIDTPVKRYSSGMYVRLAFAVAAHLDPEILIVDEVLAVGDFEFQKKCLGKMGEVANQGRTVLIVSHNMASVMNLCRRTILLEKGKVISIGPTAKVVEEYMKEEHSKSEMIWSNPTTAPGNKNVRLHAVRILSHQGESVSNVDIQKDFFIEHCFWNFREGAKLMSSFHLLDNNGTIVFATGNLPSASLAPDQWYGKPSPIGLFRSTCRIPGNFLNEGTYYISSYVTPFNSVKAEAFVKNAISFGVIDTGGMRKEYGGTWIGVVRPRFEWKTEFKGC